MLVNFSNIFIVQQQLLLLRVMYINIGSVWGSCLWGQIFCGGVAGVAVLKRHICLLWQENNCKCCGIWGTAPLHPSANYIFLCV